MTAFFGGCGPNLAFNGSRPRSTLPIPPEFGYGAAMYPRNHRANSTRVCHSGRLAVGVSVVVACCVGFGCAENQPPPAAPIVSAPPLANERAVVPAAAASAAPAAAAPKPQVPTWTDDVKFLEAHGQVIQLESAEHGVVAVSAKYQGRVMTSAVTRDAPSLGYLNRQFISEGKTGTEFDNYGGEDRFWLGPEGSQYSVFFAKGQSFELKDWQTPVAVQEGEWTIGDKNTSQVVFSRTLKLTNRAGATFEMDVKRTVRVMTNQEVLARLTGITTLGPTQWVGFETTNQITNKGKKAWTKRDGLVSVWILSQFNPSPDTNVVIPFEVRAEGEIVNDHYFGVVPSERLHVYADQGFLTFQCDGQRRSKIGLGPARAKGWLGSYNEAAGLLTLVNYDRVAGAKDYVNSLWAEQKDPYAGDVINSYNEGPSEAGKPAPSGFYEMETSSPGAALEPGRSLTHTQRTLHFVGKRADLEPLAKAALGVSLDRVVEVTKPPAK